MSGDIGHFYRSESRPVGTLQKLRLGSHVFTLDDGTPFTAIEATSFNCLARMLREGTVAIRAVLQQYQACLFNMIRVWTLFRIPGIGDLTLDEFPMLYQAIPDFVALCAEYGLYVEFTAYTGVNDPNHWRHLGEAAHRCHPYPLLEWVNEYDVNAAKLDYLGRPALPPSSAQPIPDLLCSHGSNGSQAWPVFPYWQYLTFHTNDAPEWQRKEGHNAMEIDGIDRRVVLTNESTRYPDRDQSLPHAQGAAESAALLCAGSCYHSVNGKQSQEWTGIELDAAKMWAASARKVPLEFQQGAYRHAVELETPGILRAYQRILPDHRAYTALVPV